MPPPDVATKKANKQPAKDPELKKTLLRDCDTKSIESTTRSIQGAGETPAPPKPTKPKKPKEKKPADTLPKKNAQRAKGSISLNKTIEQVEAEPKQEKLARADTNSIGKDCPAEEVKTPTQKRKKKQPRPLREAGEKPEKTVVPKRKPSVVEPTSCESIDEKTLEVVNQEPVEVKSDEIRAVTTGFNSCSFFEKIQQGVKAYFTSRSSFNPEDRNKKEGGNQTRGSVGKRGEEEIEKGEPGIKIKISSSDRVLLCDRLRYLGGHSSNFLSTKPKLLRHFRKLKRKKLYHPKKCYVRIQIPRKGYFYRSTVGLQSPELESQPPAKTKVNPKSQISGLAPARANGVHLRNKTGLKKQEAPRAAQPPKTRPFTPKYMKRLLSEFRDLTSAVDFEEKVSEYVALNWPDLGQDVSFEDGVVQFESVQPEREGRISGIPESFNEQGTDNKADCPEGDQSWNNLVNCFNSAIRNDQIVCNLEISQMTGGMTPFRETVLQSIEEEQETVEPAQQQSATLLCSADTLMGGVDLHLELQNYLKAIEGFQTAKTKSKNTLQCNFYDNYVPLKLYSSSQDLQKRAEEYFDVAENRSGTSFDSATSDCPQLEEVTNEMLLDVTATGPEPTVRRGSKPEVDPGKQQQTLKNSVKRTAGITSFQVFRLDDKATWGPSYLQAECTKHTGGLSHDDYEKIQPLDAGSTARKSKRSGFFQNFLRQSEQPPESAPSGELSNPQDEQNLPWSPTLQELIDIYNSVLKQNTKIRRNSKVSVNRCFSSHLFSFLNEKLQEKQYKADLLNLSKDFRMDSKTITKLGKPVKSSTDLMKLEEYVGMFQEILHSSLSIQQITRLNNILAGLQDYSEKNYNYIKDLKEDVKKLTKEPSPETVKTRVPSPRLEARPKTAHGAPRKPKKSVRFETPKKPVQAKPQPKAAQRKAKTPQKLKPKPKPVKEKIETIELPAPAKVESILKLCSNGVALNEEDMSEKKKILLTVKLHGNQVLVSGFSRFDSESSLMSEQPESKGVSELIVENVTKKNISSDVWWKNTKSSRLRMQNQENSKKRLKKPTKVTTKGRKQQMRSKSTESDSELYEQEKAKKEFEYDQMQLRVQHPIEAIAEMSESKVSQQVDKSEEEQRKGEPPPETKILLEDIPASPKAMKEALKAVLEQKVFSKDLNYDFGWSEEELGKTLTPKRLRSKRRPTSKKTTRQHAVVVRSMVDLKKRQTPAKTKIRKADRHSRTYLCYSALQSPSGKANKKTQRRARSPSPAAPKPKPKRKACRKASNEKQSSENSELTTSKSEPPSLIYKTAETALDKPQPLVDVPANRDGCELEFIFSEKPDADPTPGGSQTTTSFNSTASLKTEDSFPSEQKEPSIALLQPSTCNDCASVLGEVIHSDSYLGNIPPPPVSHSKLDSLFKSNSELKFYPGRLQEGGTGQEKPIVTFVLTPSQHEQAQLPENQVKIVKRQEPGPSSSVDKEKEEIPESNTEEGRDEISLESIEDFINYLSKCRKLSDAKKKRSKPPPAEKKLESSSAKCFAKTKTPATANRSLSSSGKTLHECHKRKPPEGDKKKPEKPAAASVTKQRVKHKKKLENSDLFLNKMVENLSRALENLRKEKLIKKEESQKVETVKTTENRDTKETSTESKGDNLTIQSMSPVEIPPEVVEAIKIAISQADDLGEEKEIIAEIGDKLCKATQNVGTACEGVPKKQKALKIKIHCNERKRSLENEEAVHPPPQEKQIQPAGEIELLDSLVSRNTEGGDLKRQKSTYFDAVEKNVEVHMDGDTNSTQQPTEEGRLDLSMEFRVTEEPKHTVLTPSDKRLLSRDVIGKDSEEVIFNKIAKAFQEGQATYSMALLEAFLSKAEDSDCVRLRKLLELVETRSKNIMMNMERAAWQKVLSLLEEVSQALEKDDARDSMNDRLETTKHFIDKIQLLNTRRLVDLQNFCSSFMSPPQENDAGGNKVIDKIKQSLKLLKDKFVLKRNHPSRNLENLDRSGLRSSGSGFKIHSTVSLPEIRENPVTNINRVTDSQELKSKIQQRYLCMQELLLAMDKSECENTPQELQEVRNRVAEKMKVVEKAFEDNSLCEALRESNTYWSKATSLLRLAKGCRKEEGNSTATGELRLDRRPGYLDLMNCLIKAWDTRMTIGAIKTECFS